MQIKANEIHLWAAYLGINATQSAQFKALLNEHELARSARFRFNIHRERFIASHGFLRELLSRYLEISPAAIQFSYNANHKPIIRNETNLMFNMSHSDDIALYAVTTQHDIGVDIEKVVEKNIAAIAKRFFSQSENTSLNQLPITNRLRGFFKLWTQKEALLKAIGTGLTIPLHSFSLSLRDQTLILLNNEQWSVNSVQIAPAFTAAVASNNLHAKIINFGFLNGFCPL